MSPKKRLLLAIQSAQTILARHVEPGGLDAKATIDALLTVLDDTEVVEAVRISESEPPMDARSSAILQDLYNSEINYTIATFWDAGVRVLLGDDLNGFVAETRTLTFVEAVQWLALATIEHYPDSQFAKNYRA